MRDAAALLRPRIGVRPEAVLSAVAIASALGFGLTLGLWWIDDRLLDGLSVWAKPLKFEAALAVHAGTLALVAARLGAPARAGRALWTIAVVFVVACVVEMGWIIWQGARGEHSHFNDSTALHRAMFTVMAVAAILITGAAAALAVLVWRDTGYRAPAPVKAGIVLGLTGGTVLTIMTAMTIGATGSPYVGAIPHLTARMPVTGWSLTGGDLRVAHFLATHMMQAVPLAALLVCLVRPGRAGLPAVLCVATLWTLWTGLEFQAALDGQPLLSWLPAF